MKKTEKIKKTTKEVGVSKHPHVLEEDLLKHGEHSDIKTGAKILCVSVEETKRKGSRIRALD
ncbi:MAG: hypothetical protein KatS3mg096_647 [Candidatus Parcubacteria bacterium]|nr:MAG: hypothetical protein KatS3mg096_647 [Candidatus Parcubacteria bacterium]